MKLRLSALQTMNNFIVKYLNGNDVPVKFAYALAKNRDKIERELKPLDAAAKTFNEFAQKKNALCIKYADKDEQGKAVMVNNVYGGLDNNPKFLDEFDKLTKEYEKPLEDFQELLESEVDFEFYLIKLADFPDKISGMSILFPLVKEE